MDAFHGVIIFLTWFLFSLMLMGVGALLATFYFANDPNVRDRFRKMFMEKVPGDHYADWTRNRLRIYSDLIDTLDNENREQTVHGCVLDLLSEFYWVLVRKYPQADINEYFEPRLLQYIRENAEEIVPE